MIEKHKICFKCGESKPLSAFYKHPKMQDGHVNKCKECNKLDVQLNYRNNIDHYKEYDQQRNSEKGTERHRKHLEYSRRKDVQQRKTKYNNLPHVIKKKKELLEKRDLEYPERKAANQAISNGVRDGKICKPQAHHSSYAEDMRLTVTWLCTECHGKVHRKYD